MIPSLGLFTDLYEFFMAQIYLERGFTENATFSLFIRKRSKKRPFFLACGTDTFLTLLKYFKFSEEDLEYLDSLKLFKKEFLDFLKNFEFEGEIRGLKEGTIFFENEPICEVTAPLPVAQLLETFIINIFHIETLVGTKALLSVIAAQGIPCVDFSARRTHGIAASLHVAKASYIAGFTATSNVLAGKLFNIPVTGTMAHSFIEAFPSEEEAFKAFAETYPERTILLIDTYDTLNAAKKVVKLNKEFLDKGIRLKGVRIDSGDLAELSKKVREILDKGGLEEVGIFLSGGIDEYKIKYYLEKGIPVSGFGVGTLMGVSADEPFLDITYKLVEYNGKPRAKLSPGKKFYPGRKEVYRIFDGNKPVEDWICLAGTLPRSKKGEPLLLTHLLWKGKERVYSESLDEIRKRVREETKAFSSLVKPCKRGFKTNYSVKISATLKKLLKNIEKSLYRAS